MYRAFIILLCLAWGCSREENYQKDFVPKLVVDGSIETGGYAHVAITRNIPYYSSVDSSNFLRLVIKQAKVILATSEKSEILTLTYNETYTPPWYYKSTEITGKEGETYTLTILWDTLTLKAQTTIPVSVKPDSVWFQTAGDNAEKGLIYLRINDNYSDSNYYKISTKTGIRQNVFTPTLQSVYADWYFNGQQYTFSLYRGAESFLALSDANDFYFNKGDTVWVKLCTMDKACFSFWKTYYSEAANGANPFASSIHSVSSNIDGGLGIWGGYGQTVTKIVLMK
jgi:hypothetical protein